MMKILIADKFPAEYQEQLKAAGHTITFNPDLGAEDLPANIGDYNILIVRSTKVSKETLDAAKGLKLVIRAGSGYNTIEFQYAATKDIAVANCPGTNSVAVAELAMGHIISLDRRLVDNTVELRNGNWNKKEYSKADGIFGKTLGIIGIGRIGQELMARAKAFGLKVIAYDPPLLTDKLAAEWGIERAEKLTDLAKKADIISVHVALVEATRNLLDADFFAAMKERAMLVNTSRGEVIDEPALMEAIKAKGLRVALDVFWNEPGSTKDDFKPEIIGLPGVYGSHHIGASTTQAQNAVAEEALRIIEQFDKSGEVRNRVN